MSNKIVTLCVGLPASGKSTWCKEQLNKYPNTVKVSRDDFRYMFRNQGWCENKIEQMITELVNTTILSCLKRNLHVLIDATNVKISTINEITSLVKYSADVKFMIFDTPVKTCIERDKLRERSVGEDVINKMNTNWKITKDSYVFQDIKQIPEWKRPVTTANINDKSKEHAVIFDIDGTIALMNNRGPYDWDKVDRDNVNNMVVDQINLHKSANRKILLVSGRDEVCREMTIDWLNTYDIHFDKLYMREKDSVQKDSIVKQNIYLNEIKPNYNVLAVYDDRLQVIKKWNELGVFVFNVNQQMIDF